MIQSITTLDLMIKLECCHRLNYSGLITCQMLMQKHSCSNSTLASVRLWKFKDGGSQKARFLQCGDQVSRISYDFLKWRSMGPQKPATIIGHKYSIFKPSKKNNGVFLIIKIRQIFRSNFFFKNFNFWGS